MVYAIMMKMKEGKTFDQGVVQRHVEHLRSLDDNGRLVICGPFKDGKGVKEQKLKLFLDKIQVDEFKYKLR